MTLELIMEFRIVLIFVCLACAVYSLRFFLNFFPKKMKYPWIKPLISLVYLVGVIGLLDIQSYSIETIPLMVNQEGLYFEQTGIPVYYPHTDQAFERLYFYSAETGERLIPMIHPNTLSITSSVKDEGYLQSTNVYSLLRGQINVEPLWVNLTLPTEVATAVADIWDLPLN